MVKLRHAILALSECCDTLLTSATLEMHTWPPFVHSALSSTLLIFWLCHIACMRLTLRMSIPMLLGWPWLVRLWTGLWTMDWNMDLNETRYWSWCWCDIDLLCCTRFLQAMKRCVHETTPWIQLVAGMISAHFRTFVSGSPIHLSAFSRHLCNSCQQPSTHAWAKQTLPTGMPTKKSLWCRCSNPKLNTITTHTIERGFQYYLK